MYQPKLARFMSRDPLPANGVELLSPIPRMREHIYVYVKNNPINLYDSSGMAAEKPDFINPGNIACSDAEKKAIESAWKFAIKKLKEKPDCFTSIRTRDSDGNRVSDECLTQLTECILKALQTMKITCAHEGQGKCHLPDGTTKTPGVTDSQCSRIKSHAAEGLVYPREPNAGPPNTCAPCNHPIKEANDCTLCGEELGQINTYLCRTEPGRKIVLDKTKLAKLLVHEASHNCVGGHETTGGRGSIDKCRRPDSWDIGEAFGSC